MSASMKGLSILFQLWLSAEGFSYSELKDIQPSCSPNDSCATNDRNQTDLQMDWTNRNCLCDNLCSEYGDCCVDANFPNPKEKTSFDDHQCVKLREYGSLYMKGKCMTGWQNEGIAEECHNASPYTSSKIDPVKDMPVTSTTSKITYKNYFCAICNNDSIALEFWKPRIECSEVLKSYNAKFGNLTLKYMFNNLVNENGLLGIYLDTVFSGNKDFHSCSIDPNMPNGVENMIRKCICTEDSLNYRNCNRPVSICSPSWNESTVENLCHSYTAVIYSKDSVAYRNIHCAICNNIDPDRLLCKNSEQLETRFNWQFLNYFNTRAFIILFDFFDISGSNVLGSACKANEIWDPFFKKCRKLICEIESHKYKFGKCVPILSTDALLTNDTSITTIISSQDHNASITNNVVQTADGLATISESINDVNAPVSSEVSQNYTQLTTAVPFVYVKGSVSTKVSPTMDASLTTPKPESLINATVYSKVSSPTETPLITSFAVGDISAQIFSMNTSVTSVTLDDNEESSISTGDPPALDTLVETESDTNEQSIKCSIIGDTCFG